MKKVTLKEEVAPEMGVKREELDQRIWNSPPAIRGEGRYLIAGRTIEAEDFTALKKAGLVWYWDEEFLDEADMFFTPPGWRINTSGIKMLADRGYEIEIDTLEMQKERKKVKKMKENEKYRKEREERENNALVYRNAIDEYETWLGSPAWTDQWEGKRGEGDWAELMRIRSSNATIQNDEYTLYSLTPAGYIAVHRHYNSDWWDTFISVDPAPPHVVAEAERLRMERAAQREKQALEAEERKKQAIYYHIKCPRCSRELYAPKALIEGKDPRCGKCHTGKVASEKTTVVMEKIGEVQKQHIPEGAEIR